MYRFGELLRVVSRGLGHLNLSCGSEMGNQPSARSNLRVCHLKLKGPNWFPFFWFCFKEIWFHLDELNVNISVTASCFSVDYSTIAWLCAKVSFSSSSELSLFKVLFLYLQSSLLLPQDLHTHGDGEESAPCMVTPAELSPSAALPTSAALWHLSSSDLNNEAFLLRGKLSHLKALLRCL